ncbi:MAG TPA: hypothetical protein VFN67_42455 [Polyangiales bacterium]|jgi:hypothetical protein|nr:hypothetical protein [Polyangiales bacterium]
MLVPGKDIAELRRLVDEAKADRAKQGKPLLPVQERLLARGSVVVSPLTR